eukprot:jgi/Galph1/5522/GphlegSOOS_G4118.1
MKVAFQLTHVVYEKNDLLGWFLALCSLAPIFLYVAEACLILFRRELFGLSLLLGQLLNESVNIFLKILFAQPRPHEWEYDRYGMPSAHSQAMCFFLATIFITGNKRRHCPLSKMEQLGFYVFLVISTVLVCTSRVYLGYHTLLQVLAGVLFGFLTGWLWTSYVQEGPNGFLLSCSLVKF